MKENDRGGKVSSCMEGEEIPSVLPRGFPNTNIAISVVTDWGKGGTRDLISILLVPESPSTGR
jgi:hypothetical protein